MPFLARGKPALAPEVANAKAPIFRNVLRDSVRLLDWLMPLLAYGSSLHLVRSFPDGFEPTTAVGPSGDSILDYDTGKDIFCSPIGAEW